MIGQKTLNFLTRTTRLKNMVRVDVNRPKTFLFPCWIILSRNIWSVTSRVWSFLLVYVEQVFWSDINNCCWMNINHSHLCYILPLNSVIIFICDYYHHYLVILISARCNIYIIYTSRAYAVMSVSVCLSRLCIVVTGCDGSRIPLHAWIDWCLCSYWQRLTRIVGWDDAGISGGRGEGSSRAILATARPSC